MATRRSLGTRFGAVFSILTVGAVVVLNTWAAMDDIDGNTISAWVTYGATHYAAIPFGLGAVLGHWATRGQDIDIFPGSGAILASVGILMALVDSFGGGALAQTPFWVWAMAGMGAGAILWPMDNNPK